MSHSQHHHHHHKTHLPLPLIPSKPPSSPPQNHSSFSPQPISVTSESDDFIFTLDDDAFSDAQAQQQLISNLLSSPSQNTSNTTTTTTSFHPQVKFVSYPYYLPFSPSFDSSSYVTINGNEETCGSSFSDTCSLMASFDTCGVRFPDAFSGVLPVHEDVVFGGGSKLNEMMNSCGHRNEDLWDWSEFLDEVRF